MTTAELIGALKGLSIEDLDKVIAAAEEARRVKREIARRALLEEIRTKADALGLSLSALLEGADQERPLAKSTRSPVRPKYRHPETGETWSGRGSAPGWLRRLEEQGRRREELAVSED